MHNHTSEERDAFLLKEYDSAKEVTFAVDELRHKISTFYGTFVTMALVGLGLFVKSGTEGAIEQLGAALPALLLTTGVVGFFVVIALARLRAAQLEHFRIINKIRAHFLGDDVPLWNVVELSGETLPIPTRKSGSYMWALMVMFLSSTLIAAGVFIAVQQHMPWWLAGLARSASSWRRWWARRPATSGARNRASIATTPRFLNPHEIELLVMQ